MAAVAAYDRSTDPHSTFKAQSFGGAVATKHHQLSFPAAPRAGAFLTGAGDSPSLRAEHKKRDHSRRKSDSQPEACALRLVYSSLVTCCACSRAVRARTVPPRLIFCPAPTPPPNRIRKRRAPRAGCPQPSRSLPTPLRAPSCELGAQRSATPRRRAAHVPSPSSAAGPDLQSACPLGKGDGADSAATSSTSTTIESVKQLKWLDREVNAGRAPVGQLDPAAGAGDRPPLRSDLYLRSYSKQPRCAPHPADPRFCRRHAQRPASHAAAPCRRRRRSVLHRLWLLATGSAAAGGGVLLSACGFGVLASCIRVGTVGTAVAASMGGTKLTICGTNQLRKLRNPDATPVRPP